MQPDPEVVAQLMSMGFSENGSKRAAVATQVSGSLLTSPCHASDKAHQFGTPHGRGAGEGIRHCLLLTCMQQPLSAVPSVNYSD